MWLFSVAILLYNTCKVVIAYNYSISLCMHEMFQGKKSLIALYNYNSDISYICGKTVIVYGMPWKMYV